MDHAPGNMASMKTLSSAPLLIGERADVLNRIKPLDTAKLTFAIDCTKDGNATFDGPQGTKSWLTLQPFYTIHSRQRRTTPTAIWDGRTLRKRPSTAGQ